MDTIPSAIFYGAAIAEQDAYYAAMDAHRTSPKVNPVAAAEAARVAYYADHGYVAN